MHSCFGTCLLLLLFLFVCSFVLFFIWGGGRVLFSAFKLSCVSLYIMITLVRNTKKLPFILTYVLK